MRTFLIFLSLLFSTIIIRPLAAEENGTSFLMWAAFRCSAFAQLSANQSEEARLFTVGLQAGREFLTAWQNGRVTDEDMHKRVPAIVIGLLKGPNPEFVLGRIFQEASDTASASVGNNSSNALYQYVSANCAIIR
jgi:hypothetical protein